MPYIAQEHREIFEETLEVSGEAMPENPGELNYLITSLCHQYLDHHSDPKAGYDLYNEIIGVLESAKLEFYRAMVAPYEDQKIEENGPL